MVKGWNLKRGLLLVFVTVFVTSSLVVYYGHFVDVPPPGSGVMNMPRYTHLEETNLTMGPGERVELVMGVKTYDHGFNRERVLARRYVPPSGDGTEGEWVSLPDGNLSVSVDRSVGRDRERNVSLVVETEPGATPGCYRVQIIFPRAHYEDRSAGGMEICVSVST